MAELAVWLLVATFVLSGLHPARPGRVEALRGYQVAFPALGFEEQRVGRALLAGLDEVCWARGEAGRWPEAGSLAAEGVFPGIARIEGRVQGEAVLYRFDGAPAWLAELAPTPTAGVDPAHVESLLADGRHRRAPDGTLVHVALWIGPPGRSEGFPFNPALEGWRELVVPAPTEVR